MPPNTPNNVPSNVKQWNAAAKRNGPATSAPFTEHVLPACNGQLDLHAAYTWNRAQIFNFLATVIATPAQYGADAADRLFRRSPEHNITWANEKGMLREVELQPICTVFKIGEACEYASVFRSQFKKHREICRPENRLDKPKPKPFQFGIWLNNLPVIEEYTAILLSRVMCKCCSDAYNKRAVRKAGRHCSDCGAVEDLSVPKPEPSHVKRSGQVICQHVTGLVKEDDEEGDEIEDEDFGGEQEFLAIAGLDDVLDDFDTDT
ncbi:hypothetical protein CNMCM5793_003930 [Aspergillus hiratsukae]|uniref:Uncharacterized protein n=1 Tax=Aspergillus hiratsukae TaxID=1194566 RepID=A0A8H6PEG3_9EURO|nr:hypothetical protein CNMCM5793_003930 [Aspergillus hiratsukae]KAF7169229.1 hypothetical protein CNMCM6106_004178 [Aspergillus hiratsukae]